MNNYNLKIMQIRLLLRGITYERFIMFWKN